MSQAIDVRPYQTPVVWAGAPSGALSEAVRAWLAGGATPEQRELVREYCREAWDGPWWEADPGDDLSAEDLQNLREFIEQSR